MTQNAMTPVQKASKSLNLMEPNISKALPQNVPSKKFMRIAQMALQAPIIAEAMDKGADASSLFNAVSNCAQDGLVLDGREAALVPFKGKIQYMPMVAGVIKKAYNSGEIASISAHVVYENDTYSYELGDNEHIRHIPSGDDPGEMVAVYAIAKLKSGGIQRVWMNKREVMKHKDVAKTKYIWNGPWEADMWEKTALKKLSKRLPQSSELERLFENDNENIDLEQTEMKDVTAEATAESEDIPGKGDNETSAAKIVKQQTGAKDQQAQSENEPPLSSYEEQDVSEGEFTVVNEDSQEGDII